MSDLGRVKSYINRAKEMKSGSTEDSSKMDTETAKKFINAALNVGNSTVVRNITEPAISSVSFQGKHTKFPQESKKSDDEKEKPKQLKKKKSDYKVGKAKHNKK